MQNKTPQHRGGDSNVTRVSNVKHVSVAHIPFTVHFKEVNVTSVNVRFSNFAE